MPRLVRLSVVLLASFASQLPTARAASAAGEARVQQISVEGGAHVLQEAGVVLAADGARVEVRLLLPKGPKGPGDAAEDAVDLRQGDQVLMANRKRIQSIEDFRAVYDALEVGAELKLGIRRGEDMFIVAVPKADPKDMGRVVMAGGPGGASAAHAGPGGAHRMSFAGPGGMRPLMGAGLLLAPVDGGQGARVVKRLPGMDAALGDADVRDGDVLTAIDGRPVADLDGFFEAWDAVAVGDDVALTFRRGEQDTSVRLSKPDAPKGRVMMVTDR